MKTWTGLVGALLAGMAVFLSACGGGGDGSASVQDAQLTVDTSAIDVVVTEGEIGSYIQNSAHAPEFWRVLKFDGLSLDNLPDGFVIAALVSDESALNQLTADFFRMNSQQAALIIHPSTALVAGEYSGEVRVVACRINATGDDCGEHMKGSPSAAIPYHFTVYPRLWTDTTETEVWVNQGSASDTTGIIQLRGVISKDDLSTTVTYSVGSDAWLTLTPVDAGYAFTVRSRDLPIGYYSAHVVISSALSGQSATFHIALGVTANSFTAVHSAFRVNVTDQTRKADLKFAVPITLSDPTISAQWEASADVPWIGFDKASGQTGESLVYRISSEQLAAMPNEDLRAPTPGGHPGVITVSHRGPLTIEPITLSVELHRFTSELESVVSPPAPAGIAGYRVEVAGRNVFDDTKLIASGPSALEIQPGGNVSVVPTVPGTYWLTTNNALGLPTSKVPATFLANVQHASGFIAATGFKRSMVYDQLRDALYVVDKTGSRLRRFKHASGAWNVKNLAITKISDVGLTPDRSKLFVTSADGALHHVDPSSMSVVGNHGYWRPFPEYRKLSQGLAFQGLHTPLIPLLTDEKGYSNDSLTGITAFLVNEQRFELVRGYDFAPSRGGWFVQSGDHDWAFFSQLQPDSKYGAAMGVLSGNEVYGDEDFSYLYRVTLYPTRDMLALSDFPRFDTLDVGLTSAGALGLVNRTQYFQRSGFGTVSIPSVPSGFRVVGSVMAADWKYIYLLAYPEAAINGDQSTTLKPRIFVYKVAGSGDFDTSVSLLANTIEVSDFPTCRRDADTTCLLDTVSATSMDGRTLFFGGDRGIAVIAVPAEFRTVNSVVRTSAHAAKLGMGSSLKSMLRPSGIAPLRSKSTLGAGG